jgi:hypothetical protein
LIFHYNIIFGSCTSPDRTQQAENLAGRKAAVAAVLGDSTGRIIICPYGVMSCILGQFGWNIYNFCYSVELNFTKESLYILF